MYVVRRPRESLRRYVDQYWFVSSKPGETTQLSVDVYVDGRADVVFNYGVAYTRASADSVAEIDFSNVDGQRTRPVQIRQKGHVHVCGIRFQPGGLSAFTGTPIADLTDLVVPVSEVIREFSDPVVRTLAAASGHPEEQATFVDETLQRAFASSEEDSRHIESVQRLSDEPPATVGELSDRLNLSQRTAERVFKRIIGVTPKFYLRIARFQNALKRLMDEPAADLATLAQACGYYDQPHLVREFHALAGGVPREYKGYMPPNLRDFAPNVVRYGEASGGKATDNRAGDRGDK